MRYEKYIFVHKKYSKYVFKLYRKQKYVITQTEVELIATDI